MGRAGRGIAMTAAVLVCLQAADKQRDLKPGFNLFSKDQDVQLGREGAVQIEKQVRVLSDRDLNDYVVRIGRKLASQAQADKYPYTFKVVQDKAINAFALPGGPTYVNTGLILAAENEGQLAGVMAHEISHVALRHGTNQASKANLIQLPAMLAGAVIGNGSIVGQLAQLGISFGAGGLLLRYSRNAERDADLLGARMMSQAGYNPIDMARFFEKLEGESGRGNVVTQFLSSHPNPGNRVKAVQEEIRYLPRGNYNADSGELPRIKQIVGGLKEEPRPAAEVSAANIPSSRPSSQLKQYRGRSFLLAHPDNWEPYGDRDANMVTIAPRGGLGRSRDGQVHVAFGVMVSYYSPPNQERADLRRHTALLIRQMQQNNPSMQAGRDGSRRIAVDGEAALVTTLYSESVIRGEREVDVLLTVARPEGLFYLIFIAPEREFRDVQGTFDEMLRSIRFSG